MVMMGHELQTLADFKRYFCIDEVVNAYETGELEIWLTHIHEHEKAMQIQQIDKKNALLLIRLYQVFGFPFEMTEEEIRNAEIL